MPSILNVDNEVPQTLRFAFAGPARTAELSPVFQAIEGRLTKLPASIRNVVFDLSTADRLDTNAGRILDVAEAHQPRLAKRCVEIQFLVPRSIYADLRRTDDLPKPQGSSVFHNGIHFFVSDPPAEQSDISAAMWQLVEMRRAQIDSGRVEILRCLGKIRDISDNRVTVSLFSEEGEIVGLLERNQFPDLALEVGKVFHYSAAVSIPGMTETVIRWTQERNVSATDVERIRKEVESRIPDDGF